MWYSTVVSESGGQRGEKKTKDYWACLKILDKVTRWN